VDYTSVSIIDIICQIVPTGGIRQKLDDYPSQSSLISEYAQSKRFWDLHEAIQVGSVVTSKGRVLGGDYVTFYDGLEQTSGKCLTIYQKRKVYFYRYL
jgi:hypothetical protein